MVSATGQIQQSTISVKRKPLQQEEKVTTPTAPPISEALLEIFEEIKGTNFDDRAAVDALSVSLSEGLTERNPDTLLTFPQVSATSSPDIRSGVPSIIPELSIEGFGTPDPNLPASQLGGTLLVNPIGKQLIDLGFSVNVLCNFS